MNAFHIHSFIRQKRKYALRIHGLNDATIRSLGISWSVSFKAKERKSHTSVRMVNINFQIHLLFAFELWIFSVGERSKREKNKNKSRRVILCRINFKPKVIINKWICVHDSGWVHHLHTHAHDSSFTHYTTLRLHYNYASGWILSVVYTSFSVLHAYIFLPILTHFNINLLWLFRLTESFPLRRFLFSFGWIQRKWISERLLSSFSCCCGWGGRKTSAKKRIDWTFTLK